MSTPAFRVMPNCLSCDTSEVTSFAEPGVRFEVAAEVGVTAEGGVDGDVPVMPGDGGRVAGALPAGGFVAVVDGDGVFCRPIPRLMPSTPTRTTPKAAVTRWRCRRRCPSRRIVSGPGSRLVCR